MGRGPAERASRPSDPRDRGRGAAPFVAGFLVLAAGMIAVGVVSYRSYEEHFRVQVEGQLSAIADLKVGELTRWRRERLGDGAVFFENRNFSGLVRRYLESPADPDARERLRTWLRNVQAGFRYDRVFLVDTRGVERMAVPPAPEPVIAHLAESVAEGLRTRQVALLDFHRDGPGRPVRLSVLVPLFDAEGGERPLGALVLRIDPSDYLYPYIQRWPVPSRTAETLLVRREGEEAVFLNELRFRSGTALTLRRSLEERSLPAVQAALGREGVFEGEDYRGARVISALRTVPDSPWFLVARMDAAEVYAPLALRMWQTVLMVALLLLGAGASLALVWRRQRERHYRERAAAAEALRRSERDLRERNEELTRFTYTASHDLKSPLVTIQTFLGYLEQDLARGDAAGVEKALGFIRTAAGKMGRLLDELLELSRIGRKVNPPEEVPLQAVVREALALVAGRTAARGVRVEVTDEPVVLRGDRTRLVEVFQNLVDNAVKFMGDQPSPRVEVGVEGAGAELVLFVRDNGIGIDPRHQAKLFGLFEKLEPGAEGTGIGLALVRRIVEVHGGRVWAQSAGRGQGACFRFTLAGTRRAADEERES